MYKFALALVVIGALNWLSVGLFQVDFLALAFGGQNGLVRAAEVAIGIGGMFCIGLFSKQIKSNRVPYIDDKPARTFRRSA